MTYKQAMEYLYNHLPMFQRIGKAALKKDLSNTIRMLELLGNPHKHFKSVHIAGTNGKGTSAHALTSILMAADYKTGLYTSPHLRSFTERIRVNGQEVQEDFVADFVTLHQKLIDEVKPSFFEVTVVMAFEYFKQQEVEIAVIETGLGGRLDSTNVIKPMVSLITMIGFDHMDLLGDTLEKIALEKAGIIKEGIPVVIGNDQREIRHVFEQVADSKNASIYGIDGYEVISGSRSIDRVNYEVLKDGKMAMTISTDIVANYFSLNIPGILETVALLRENVFVIPEKAVLEGFSNVKGLTGLKGRMQVIRESPLILADVSHNESGLKLLMEQIQENLTGKLHLVFGVVRDKDLDGIFKVFPGDALFYWTTSQVPRSLPAPELQERALAYGFEGDHFSNVNEAIVAAEKTSDKGDIILICGSTFVVSEIDDL